MELERYGHRNTATTYRLIGGSILNVLTTWSSLTGRQLRRKSWFKSWTQDSSSLEWKQEWKFYWADVEWHITM